MHCSHNAPMPKPEFTCAVTVRPLPEQSQPEAGVHAFAYTVTIRNTGDVAAQLISRHWIITDANNKVEEVRGLPRQLTLGQWMKPQDLHAARE